MLGSARLGLDVGPTHPSRTPTWCIDVCLLSPHQSPGTTACSSRQPGLPARMAGDITSKAFGKLPKKKQNLEMFDALESTIVRVGEQSRRIRGRMDGLLRRIENLETDAATRGHQGLAQVTLLVSFLYWSYPLFSCPVLTLCQGGRGWELATPRASSPTDFSPPSVTTIRRYREATPKVMP